MRFAAPTEFGSPIRFELIVAMAYLLALSVLGLFHLLTMESGVGADGRPLAVLSSGWFWRLTAGNAALGVLLAFGAWRARLGSIGVRRAQLAGLFAGGVTLIAAQVGLALAARMI